MSNKNYIAKIKMSVKNGSEADIRGTPGLAATLGQKQVNQKAFIDEFKKVAAKFPAGAMLTVKVYTQAGNKFIIDIKDATTSSLIKETLKIGKGSGKPKLETLTTLSLEQAKKIAERKMEDIGAGTIEAALSNVKATAASMGIIVK